MVHRQQTVAEREALNVVFPFSNQASASFGKGKHN